MATQIKKTVGNLVLFLFDDSARNAGDWTWGGVCVAFRRAVFKLFILRLYQITQNPTKQVSETESGMCGHQKYTWTWALHCLLFQIV